MLIELHSHGLAGITAKLATVSWIIGTFDTPLKMNRYEAGTA
jgi:hypothetical protein